MYYVLILAEMALVFLNVLLIQMGLIILRNDKYVKAYHHPDLTQIITSVVMIVLGIYLEFYIYLITVFINYSIHFAIINKKRKMDQQNIF